MKKKVGRDGEDGMIEEVGRRWRGENKGRSGEEVKRMDKCGDEWGIGRNVCGRRRKKTRE